jgi:hypothetical protein
MDLIQSSKIWLPLAAEAGKGHSQIISAGSYLGFSGIPEKDFVG